MEKKLVRKRRTRRTNKNNKKNTYIGDAQTEVRAKK